MHRDNSQLYWNNSSLSPPPEPQGLTQTSFDLLTGEPGWSPLSAMVGR
jgi:hypothetical protein